MSYPPPPYPHTGYPQPSPYANAYPQQYPPPPMMASVATAYPPVPPPGMVQNNYAPYSMAHSPAHPHTIMPESPTSISPEQEENNMRESSEGPSPVCRLWQEKIWGLKVVQEPLRARMCGFGDKLKDRRPISAPPILKLVILNSETKEEIDYEDSSLELSHFVCVVDIYDRNGLEEKNMLRATQSQQSISTAHCGNYPTARVDQTMPGPFPVSVSANDVGYVKIHGQKDRPPTTVQTSMTPMGMSGYSSTVYTNGMYPTTPGSTFPLANAPPQYVSPSQRNLPAPNPYAQQPLPGINTLAGPSNGTFRSANPLTPPAEISGGSPPPGYNRTLIGQLCSSAQRLRDDDDKMGIWFIFPDLSVRTEDWFRLKFSFFNVGKCLAGLTTGQVLKEASDKNCAPSTPLSENANPARLEGLKAGLVADRAPCLAHVFSKPFKVYSAKKFPGVAESTGLSKKFADQGIKISIRKDPDAKKGSRKRERESSASDDDNDEEES